MSDESKNALQQIEKQFLIVKDPVCNDFKINYSYLFSQILKNRRILYSLFASAIIISLYFILNLPTQYQIISTLSQPNINDYKTLLDYTELLSNPQITKELTIKWGNSHKSLFVQYNNTDRPIIEQILFSKFIKTLLSSHNVRSFAKYKENNSKNSLINKKSFYDNSFNQFNANNKVRMLPDGALEFTSISTNPNVSIKEQQNYFSYTNKKVVQKIILDQQALALQTINSLKKEINQIPIENSAELNAKKAKLEQIRSLDFNITQIKTYNIDEEPFIQIIPLQVKKRQIILFSLSFALFLSLLLIIRRSNLVESWNLS